MRDADALLLLGLLVLALLVAGAVVVAVVIRSRRWDAPETAPLVRTVLVGGWLLAAAVVVLVGSALFDDVTVGSRAALDDLRFGEPFAWIEQDQSILDPPSFPNDHSVLTPLEYPTRVLPVPFLVDLAILGAVIAAPVLVARRRGLPDAD